MLNLVELREIAGHAYEAHHEHLRANSETGTEKDVPAWRDVDRATRNAWVMAVVETIDRSDKRRYQRGGRRRLIPKDRPAVEV